MQLSSVNVEAWTQDAVVETGLCKDVETSDTDSSFSESLWGQASSRRSLKFKLYIGSLSVFQERPDHIHTCCLSLIRLQGAMEAHGLSVEVMRDSAAL